MGCYGARVRVGPRGADRANLSLKITTQKGGYFFGKKQRERFEKGRSEARGTARWAVTVPVCVSGRVGGPIESLIKNNHPKGWIFFWQKAERFKKTPHPSAFGCHLLPLEKALVKTVTYS